MFKNFRWAAALIMLRSILNVGKAQKDRRTNPVQQPFIPCIQTAMTGILLTARRHPFFHSNTTTSYGFITPENTLPHNISLAPAYSVNSASPSFP